MSAHSDQGIQQALLRANELQDASWHCGPFSAEGNILALCAFPGRYLVLRGTRFVSLPFRMKEAGFRATEESGFQKVRIRSRGREFCVVCEDVAFYEGIEYPVGIRDVWNEHPEP